MNKIADNINGILDFAVFALRFLLFVVYDIPLLCLLFNLGTPTAFGLSRCRLFASFKSSCVFARARLSTSFRNGNSFLYLAGVGTKKVPASSRNCCASISIWFQIKRTQPKVLANRTCCSDVGYARYFIALFSFCAGTAVTTFYYLVYSVRTLCLLKSVAIHPPHE